MDFPRPSVSPSNIIGDLKDRFGFGGAKQRSYDEEPYYDEYDEYGYDEPHSYDSGDQYASSSQADPYDRLEYTTRSTAGRPSRTSSYSTSPHLVSSDDIRATTSAYGVSSAATGDATYGSYRSSRSSYDVSSHSASSASTSLEGAETEQYDVPATAYGDFVSPYKEHAHQSTAASSYGASATGVRSSGGVSNGALSGASSGVSNGVSSGTSNGASRSAGLDSLFSPTTEAGTPAQGSSALTSPLAGHSASSTSSGATEAGAGSTSMGSASTSTGSLSSREITLLQPVTYEDVASVARSVRLGNIVVLSLRSTDAALAKRVLDFSFGVASALDARVDCVADKTFIVMQGGDLSLEERHRLQKQGIL